MDSHYSERNIDLPTIEKPLKLHTNEVNLAFSYTIFTVDKFVF